MAMLGVKEKIYDKLIGNEINPDVGHIGELNNKSYKDQENQPLFIRNTRLHHLQEDVLDKGPLLNDLLYSKNRASETKSSSVFKWKYSLARA